MMAADVASIAVTLLVANVAHRGTLQIWHLYGIAALLATISAFHYPSLTAIISPAVPDDKLTGAHAGFQVGRGVADLLPSGRWAARGRDRDARRPPD